MKIGGFLKRSMIGSLMVMLIPFGALSLETVTSGKAFSRAELDQMLAPIALYPDALLDRILVAASFPDQLAEEDRWLKRNANIAKSRLNAAMDTMDWDSSVKALAPFPQILDMMVGQSAWTQKLGEAYSAQERDVMASIQRLRSRAYAKGNLQTSAEQQVVVEGDTIEIEPVNPKFVYVPRYDPDVVYGTWGWLEYPPFAYYPDFPSVDADVGVFGFFGAVDVGAGWGGDAGDVGGGGGGHDHGRHGRGHDHGGHGGSHSGSHGGGHGGGGKK
jgi:hypothetical protein